MIFFDGIFGFSESGMTRYLITSNHNQFAATLIPTLLVAHVRYYYKANKMSLLILHIIAVLTVLIPGSMTATVSILLWIIYFYFFRASRFKKIVIYCIAGGIIFFFIIFILLPSYKFDNNLVSGFVEFIGKDMTFSNRTVIWIRTIAEIIEKPIMGEGLYSREWGEVYIGSINAHNIILQLLLQGGVILLSLFSILLGYVIKKIVKHDNIEYKLLVLISIVLFFLMSMFEVYNYNMLFIYIIILYVASFYENEYEIS
ncbi:MAG: O-antigen ligase family protein [bacterium]